MNARTSAVRPGVLIVVTLVAAALMSGCEPQDRRPGLWLSGEPRDFPQDWAFTDAYKEISLEVATPYLVPHSVTIWCASMDGDLYLAASRAAEKNWPGWVDADPDVVLKIGQWVFPVRLEALVDPAATARLQMRYAEKYQLPSSSGVANSGTRYWKVRQRG